MSTDRKVANAQLASNATGLPDMLEDHTSHPSEPNQAKHAPDAQCRQRVWSAFKQGHVNAHPRHHQVDAVVSLLKAVQADCWAPNPTNYLLQHSTGSGKSLTIALLASQLVGWKDEQGNVFDMVLVVNDRLQLDQQLSNTVTSFLKALGFKDGAVRRAASSTELLQYINAVPGDPDRPSVVLTTLQKLVASFKGSSSSPRPHAIKGKKRQKLAAHNSVLQGSDAVGQPQSRHASRSRVAIIADEAHRSHGHGSTSLIFKMLSNVQLAGNTSAVDTASISLAAFKKHQAINTCNAESQSVSRLSTQHTSVSISQQPRNLTYIGFTATPSPMALQLFGVCKTIKCDVLGDVLGDMEEGEDTTCTSESIQDVIPAPKVEPVVEYTPFHVYSMEQAVADGHVINVLQRYINMTTLVQITGVGRQQSLKATSPADTSGSQLQAQPPGKDRSVKGNDVLSVLLGEKSGVDEAALIDAAYSSKDVIARKAEYAAQQFLDMWQSAIEAGFKEFRGMVVARSRRHVVWWVQELRKALAKQERWANLHHEAYQEPAVEATGRGRRSHTPGYNPAVYGAFSGHLKLSEAELQDIDKQLEEERQLLPAQCSGNQCFNGLDGSADEGMPEFGGQGAVNGGKYRRNRPGNNVQQKGKRLRKNPWDAALAHIDNMRSSAGDGDPDSSKPEALENQSSSLSDGTGSDSAMYSEAAGSSTSEVGSSDIDSYSEAVSGTDVSNSSDGFDSEDEPLLKKRSKILMKQTSSQSLGAMDDIQSVVSPKQKGDSLRKAGQPFNAGCDDMVNQVMLQVTEADINGGRGANHHHARILVCCNKFETGYDDARLGVLFIDRSLSGARAVQVLGRLNRPAPLLRKDQHLVGVVDFVNSVGPLRESFEQFWGTTTLRTGRAARRLRMELRMDHAVTQILEALQIAATRAALATQAARQQQGTTDGAAHATSPAATVISVLQSLTPKSAAMLIACMPQEMRGTANANLMTYVSTAQSLGREKQELPLSWAAQLQKEAQKLQKNTTTKSASGTRTNNDGSDVEEDADPSHNQNNDMQVICELQEQYCGAIHISSNSITKPLPSRRLISNSRSSTEAVDGSRKPTSTQADKNRSLSEVIAAANARLSSALGPKAAAKLAAALNTMCDRLREAVHTNPASLLNSNTAAVDNAVDNLPPQPTNTPNSEIDTTSNPSQTSPASVSGAGFRSDADIYLATGILRRFLLWPVTAAVLRDTGAGRLVASLRRHPNHQVAELANHVTTQWKNLVTSQQANKSQSSTANGRAASPGVQTKSDGAKPAAAAMDATRKKAADMLADALMQHKAAVESAKLVEMGDQKFSDASLTLTDSIAKHLGKAIEHAVYQHSNKLASPKQEYRNRIRLLLKGLALPDGVTPQLLAGEMLPDQVALLDSQALASAAVRKQAEEAVRKRREEEEKWERAVGGSIGIGTFITEQAKCKNCGSNKATVHTVMSGGTYAQERTQIQKFVCQDCNHTWRSDD